ncbi:P-loop containing nucleoside triphosphate hydrolase protein [Aspergillus oleicola]
MPATPSRGSQHGPTTGWEWADTPRPDRLSSQSLSARHPPSKRRRSKEQESPITQRVARCRAPARNRRRWRMEEARAVLERMYGEDATYRSAEQERAMKHVINGDGQVLAILRTSEGKSLLYLLPCQLPGAGTTVLILPLVVLKAEMQRRCHEADLEAHVWEPKSRPEQLHSCPLIIVAVEQAVHPPFREFLNRLAIANELDWVVFDKCHLAVTALNYRPVMGLLPLLRELECQMVFLTATMPPSLLDRFQQAMFLHGARMVRSPTTRRDLRYEVLWSAARQQFLPEFAIPHIRTLIMQIQPDERAIIYCGTKNTALEVAQAITAPLYHLTSGSVDDKADVLQRWRDGDPVYIMATSAFGLGIDHPAVRHVVHVGVPLNMIDFAQEVGRLGRDGWGG